MSRIRLTWDIGAFNPEKHYIYRSDSEISPNNLPSPIAEVGQGVNEYVDDDGIVEDETYHYFVAAEKKGLFVPTNFNVKAPTILLHNIFNDNTELSTYQFNGDTKDLGRRFNSPNSNDISYGDGLFNQSVVMNSGSSYVDINMLPISEDFTLSMWIWTPQNSQRNALFDQWASRATYRLIVRYNDDGTKFTVWIGEESFDDINIPYNADEWNFVVMRRKGSSITFGVNDTLITEVGLDGALPNTNTLRLGQGRNVTGRNAFVGTRYDQVRLFSRALDDREIQVLYNEGAYIK